jgi:hypothetical protein
VLGSSAQPAWYVGEKIRRLRALTTKPFGVNVILATLREGVLDA